MNTGCVFFSPFHFLCFLSGCRCQTGVHGTPGPETCLLALVQNVSIITMVTDGNRCLFGPYVLCLDINGFQIQTKKKKHTASAISYENQRQVDESLHTYTHTHTHTRPHTNTHTQTHTHKHTHFLNTTYCSLSI